PARRARSPSVRPVRPAPIIDNSTCTTSEKKRPPLMPSGRIFRTYFFQGRRFPAAQRLPRLPAIARGGSACPLPAEVRRLFNGRKSRPNPMTDTAEVYRGSYPPLPPRATPKYQTRHNPSSSRLILSLFFLDRMQGSTRITRLEKYR